MTVLIRKRGGWFVAAPAALLLAACGQASGGHREDAPFPVTAPVTAAAQRLPDRLDRRSPMLDALTEALVDWDVRLTWRLPADAGPGDAVAFRLVPLPAAEAARRGTLLARALGMSGAPRRAGGRLTWGGPYADRRLVVDLGPGTPWAYTRDGAHCTDTATDDATMLAHCLPISTGDWSREDRRHTDVPLDRARHEAAPVIAAAGLSAAAAEATPTWGTTLVDVAPTVRGRPTWGLSTGVVVDRAGVLSADGWLGAAAPAGRYPVQGPAATRATWVPPSTTYCPADPAAGSFVSPDCARPEVVVGRPRLGLARWDDPSGRLLVPAWLFRGRAADPARPVEWQAAVPALVPRRLGPPPWLPR